MSKKPPIKRFKRAWECMHRAEQIAFALPIITLSAAARIAEGIMKSWRTRIFFAGATVLCFALLFSLADRMPREAVAAGVVLGFVLAIITVFIWFGGSPPPVE
jgi:uncharacterized membrane protein YkvI